MIDLELTSVGYLDPYCIGIRKISTITISRHSTRSCRPKHSGSIALDGVSGRLSYGASIAYTGARIDTDFDLYPAPRVRLTPYWLASGQIAYRLLPRLDATLRVANGFNAHYQDVVGYRTEGRSIHVGVRFADRR